jgi:uncharacterized RDD family membrane protein YckC
VKPNPQLVTIETPEHVELQFVLAGIGARFLAYAMDRLIQACLIVGLVFTVVIVVISLERVIPVVETLTGLSKSLGQWLLAAGILLYGLISLGYFMLFEYLWNGATPGKRALYVRVIRADGRPLSFLDAAVRNILRFLDILGDVYPLGLAVMFVDSRHRRLGDLAAGTLVVVEKPVGKPTLREPVVEPQAADPDVRWVALQMLPEDHLLVSRYLSRREGLDVRHRDTLAQSICHRLYQRADKTLSPTSDPETVLEAAEMLYREKTRIL